MYVVCGSFFGNYISEGEIDIYPISRKRGFDLDTMDDYEYFKTISNE